MQYIRLVNFIDVCSNAFLYILDESVDHIDRKGNLTVNITRKITQMFNHYINEEVYSYKHSGQVVIFYNTCRPALNWRKSSNILPPKYFVNDETVLVHQTKLDAMIDNQWNMVLKNKNYKTIGSNVMDTLDIEESATHIIGSSFLSSNDQSFKILCDGNKIYHDSLLFEIPDYLNNEMKIQLRTHGIT